MVEPSIESSTALPISIKLPRQAKIFLSLTSLLLALPLRKNTNSPDSQSPIFFDDDTTELSD